MPRSSRTRRRSPPRCESNSGDLLPFVGTPNVVADVEAIRVALGEPRISYLGFSYGTLLGALYADRYPDRVRAMVLDAPLDPSLDLEGLLLAQARGFQRQLDAFLAACAKDATCPLAADGDPRAAFEAAMARFAGGAFDGVSQAVAIGGVAGLPAGGRRRDPRDGARRRPRWRGRAPVLRERRLEPSRLDPQDAVVCVDLPGPRTPDELQAMADRLAAVSPDFGALLALQGLPCLAWPVPAQREPATVRAAGAPPILVVTATGDPNTPPELGQALADQLESGVLVTRDGAGHTSMMRSDCVREIEETLPDRERLGDRRPVARVTTTVPAPPLRSHTGSAGVDLGRAGVPGRHPVRLLVARAAGRIWSQLGTGRRPRRDPHEPAAAEDGRRRQAMPSDGALIVSPPGRSRRAGSGSGARRRRATRPGGRGPRSGRRSRPRDRSRAPR